jgi:hypothetical protein
VAGWSFPTNRARVLLRITHDPGVRLRDVGGVVRATLERSPRERPTHVFPIVDLQVQRHIRGHPQFAAYQVSRAGLVHVPWDSVETNPPPAADQLLPHHAERNLAGHEFAPVEIRLDGQAEAVRRAT